MEYPLPDEGYKTSNQMNNKLTLKQQLRSLFRKCILDSLGTVAKPAPGIHILNGHRIEDEAEPGTFRQMLEELSTYVSFIRIEDAVEMIERKEQPSKPMVAFTFDDGFMECYEIFAPVLESFNTNALYFINPNYVESDENYIQHFNNEIVLTPNKLPMRWEHLKELTKRGHVIGAHTMDHFMIDSTDVPVLRYQIETCKQVIEENMKQACSYFAFPYGKLSQANQLSIEIATKTYPHVFSQSDYKHYFSFNGTVINRRHFEPFWPAKHVKYFLSCKKSYE